MSRYATGHVRLAHGRRGDVYYLKYRLPNGKQVQRKLGAAHTGSGRPRAGHYTRKMAEAELRAALTDADRATLHGSQAPTGLTFGDACDEWLRWVEHDRKRKLTMEFNIR